MPRGAENLSILREKTGAARGLRTFRSRAHQSVDDLCNELTRSGSTVRGIAVVVAYADANGLCSRSREVFDNNYEMLQALELTAFKLKLQAFEAPS